jgi:hypothetical protein
MPVNSKPKVSRKAVPASRQKVSSGERTSNRAICGRYRATTAGSNSGMTRQQTVAAQGLPLIKNDAAGFGFGRRIENRLRSRHRRNCRSPPEDTAQTQ